MRKERRIKVQGGSMFMPKGSEIRLRGQWLKAAGFPKGVTVKCTAMSPGVLEIRALPAFPAEVDGQYFEAAKRLDAVLAKV